MSNLYCLSEAQMERLRPYFPKSRGRARVDDRRVLSGIILLIAMVYGGVMLLRNMGRQRRYTIVGSAGVTWACLPGS
jgi:transposase